MIILQEKILISNREQISQFCTQGEEILASVGFIVLARCTSQTIGKWPMQSGVEV